AQGLTAASTALQESAGQLTQLKARGLDITDDWLSAYNGMATSLSLAARSTTTGSYDETRIALQLFATELASAFPTTPDTAHPEIGITFATARDEANTSADMAGLLADLKGDGKVARRLAAIA